MAENKLVTISPQDLLVEVEKVKSEGYRIVQICSTKVKEGGYELTYTFGKDYDLLNLRLQVPEGETISSISHIYSPAFLYENEIHDLFGVSVKFMTLDYKGNLYRTAVEAPFK